MLGQVMHYRVPRVCQGGGESPLTVFACSFDCSARAIPSKSSMHVYMYVGADLRAALYEVPGCFMCVCFAYCARIFHGWCVCV